LSFGREYHALCTLKIPWQSLLRGGYWAPAPVCKEKITGNNITFINNTKHEETKHGRSIESRAEWVRDPINHMTFIDTILNPRCSTPSILATDITGSEEVDFLIF
jgi:hypothetical protein